MEKGGMEMKWIVFSDPAVFAERTEPLLYEREDKYSLFIGILAQIRNGRYDQYLMATIESENRVIAACLMTPPHPLQIVLFEAGYEIGSFIADRLHEQGTDVPGVIGDREAVQPFAEAWADAKQKTVKVIMNEGLYRLDEVDESLEKSEGSWRIAGKNDGPLLEKWYRLFLADVGLPDVTIEEATEKIALFLKEKEVYVWEVGGEVVSCLKKNRPTKKGITISFVFTPKEHRRKGYARTLVAEVSEELLVSFDFCVLYTDLLNPTSNKIYQEIGYRQIANPVYLGFE